MNKIKPFVSAGLLFLVLCTIIGIAACVSHDLPVLDTPLWFVAVVAMSYTVFNITFRFYGWLKKDNYLY